MSATTETGLEPINVFLTTVEGRIAQWALDVGRAFDAHAHKLTGAAIDRTIRPVVADMLSDSDIRLAGAGFIANVGLLAPDRSFIAWWQGDDMERVDALANVSTTSQSRYLDAEWFRTPLATGKLAITGPYIDLLCTDEFVLTFTVPVYWRGEPSIAGIVGLDVTVATLERVSADALRSVGPSAAIVNAEGRIVVSASPRCSSGDFADIDPTARSRTVGSVLRVVEET
ncbi:hypothetical protein HH308_29120 [Gordonia sp. TBRC 11910]|uniref:Cache domain-containing protein n=1 Tax=Gordonia asplenii TaxID=2725283 RepID=A0A848L408_9ACTN|nr:hypothetical protein [Gordonia asplenii]NMO05287.1 hypothetical protein [Gordonia asplenii]